MADFYALGELLIDFTPAGKTPAGIPILSRTPAAHRQTSPCRLRASVYPQASSARWGRTCSARSCVIRSLSKMSMSKTSISQTIPQRRSRSCSCPNPVIAISAFTVTPVPIRRSRSMRSIRMHSQTPRCCASARFCSPRTRSHGCAADCFLRPRARCYHRLRPELARTAVAKCRSRHPRHEESAAACRCRQSVR